MVKDEEEEETILGRQKVINELSMAYHQAISEYQKGTGKEVTIAEVVHAFYNLIFVWGGERKRKEIREEMLQAAQDRQGMPLVPMGRG